jgi:hypothetical protein
MACTFDQNAINQMLQLIEQHARKTAGAGALGHVMVGFDISVDSAGSMVLVPTGVVAGTYGSDTDIPVITIDANGRTTQVSEESILPMVIALG